MTKEFGIRNMTHSEVDELVGWAAQEGWNPGLDDADLFWATDPDAFIAAKLAGELIGGGAITSYQGEFGFMGFFIVRPEFRGKGLGNILWHSLRERLLARLRPGASIGLDGAFAMQDYYAKGGFVFSHRNIRFRAEIPKRPITPTVDNEDIVPLAEVPFDQVLAYDRCRRDGNLSGYGVVRRCGQGHKIGPLFADDAQTAYALYGHLAERAAGGPLVPRRPGEQSGCARAGTPTPDGRSLRLCPDVSGPGPEYRPPAHLWHHHL